jgi:hypothetical protein
MKDEPKRWAEAGSDAPDALRDLLATGRQPLGAASELAELRARLGQMLPHDAGLAQPELARPSGALLRPRGVGWVLGGFSTAAIATIWFIARQPAVETAPPPSSAISTETATREAEPLPPSTAEPESLPPTNLEESPSAAPDTTLPRASGKSRSTVTRPHIGPAFAHMDEAELLKRAQAALSERPRETLSLTVEHERRFAAGALREEREVLAIDALRKLGRVNAARERASRFEQRYPDSVHLEKIRGR